MDIFVSARIGAQLSPQHHFFPLALPGSRWSVTRSCLSARAFNTSILIRAFNVDLDFAFALACIALPS